MALDSKTVWEVRTTGSDTNGGGYVAGAGTDYSAQDAAQVAVADAVANGTTTLTSATAGFTSAHVNNVVYLAGGSGSLAGTRRQIASVTNSTTAVLDALVATGSGLTLNLGGGCASPGGACQHAVGGNGFFVKYGSYSLTVNTNNVSNGRPQFPGGVDASQSFVSGYDTTRARFNTDANRPTITHTSTAAGLGANPFTDAGRTIYVNLQLVQGAGANVRPLAMGSRSRAYRVKASFASKGSGDWAVLCNNNNHLYDCEAVGATYGGFIAAAGSTLTRCAATNCTTVGFSGQGVYYGCLAYSNQGDGFYDSGYATPFQLFNCTSYGNGGNGFSWRDQSPGGGMAVGCVAYGNSAYGFGGAVELGNGLAGVALIRCAAGSNTSGATRANPELPYAAVVVLTADPFTNKAGGDFSLNTAAGGGALLRGVGFTLPGLATTSYLDIGSVQHADPAGGGGSGFMSLNRVG